MYDWSGKEFEAAALALFKYIEKSVNRKDGEQCERKASPMSRLYKKKADAFRAVHHTAMAEITADADASFDNHSSPVKPVVHSCLCGVPHDANTVVSADYLRVFVPRAPDGKAYMGIGLPCVYRATVADASMPVRAVVDDYANFAGSGFAPATAEEVQDGTEIERDQAEVDRVRGQMNRVREGMAKVREEMAKVRMEVDKAKAKGTELPANAQKKAKKRCKKKRKTKENAAKENAKVQAADK